MWDATLCYISKVAYITQNCLLLWWCCRRGIIGVTITIATKNQCVRCWLLWWCVPMASPCRHFCQHHLLHQLWFLSCQLSLIEQTNIISCSLIDLCCASLVINWPHILHHIVYCYFFTSVHREIIHYVFSVFNTMLITAHIIYLFAMPQDQMYCQIFYTTILGSSLNFCYLHSIEKKCRF